MQYVTAGKRVSWKRRIGLLLAIILIAAGTGLGVYIWQQSAIDQVERESTEAQEALRDQIKELQDQVDELQAEDQPEDTSSPTALTPTAAKVIVENARWSELGDYLAGDQVMVILAATEGLGSRSSAQLVNDLRILENATSPWNFELPTSVVSGYRSGDYGRYIPADNVVVGRSSDGHVVVFSLNTDGKITDIFISPDENLL